MKQPWALQDAKNRFSEVVDRAQKGGPQIITRRGKETAVVLSIEEFRRLTAGKDSLVTFIHESPLAGADISFDRPPDTGRQVDL